MRKRIRRIAIWGLVVVSLLAITWTSVLLTGKQRLDDELAYWRGQGLDIPINAGFNIKTDETGDPRILRVIELYKDVPVATLELIDKPDDADPEALTRAVQECDEILVLIHEIAAQDQAIWRGEVLESDAWLDDLIPRLSHPRSIARLLDAQALSRAQRGDLDGACESIVAGLSVARQVGEHPAMIAVLVEAAIIEMMIARFESVYAQGGVPIQALIDALEAFDVEAMFLSTLKWEGVYMARVTTGHVLSPWSMHDIAYALRRYRGKVQHIEMHGFPLHRINFDDIHPWWVRRYRITEPALGGFQEQFVRVQARIELAKSAALLRQYTGLHGAYPERLEELDAPAVDPFTGNHFLYQKRENGFVITTIYEAHLNQAHYVWEWEE